ncbi:uncharacterized protein FOMMEDRAFT_137196 [Fomitiporia mediterranea MF3/22]|uniref:uncharacterized protein n=1 Tax=Fomitiporia mediterranea (strain MF3/22) TaxID=694068 RepID=UPI0004408623|nr:uncharacterized protein FOMMEDRAFT_137196 [Fomitiporia mediterranea MF3/22]EJC98310.1 hypothetical protein FOMMEDRAFT_137196 [Fomitiporia mediterranea MF3/22]
MTHLDLAKLNAHVQAQAKRRIDDAHASNATDVAKYATKKAKIVGAGTTVRRSARLATATGLEERTGKEAEIADAVYIVRRFARLADSRLETGHGSMRETEEKEIKIKHRKSSAKILTAQSQKGEGGQPETFMNTPVDIFYKIAKYLTPRDLLCLSRTSKGLRSVLTSKQTDNIWRTARETFELPNCPPDLSEIQYAELVFGKHCCLCNAPRARNVFYEHRMRLCGRCRDAKLVNCSLLAVHCYYRFDELRSVHDKLHALTARSSERAKFIAERKQKIAEIRKHVSKLQEWLREQASIKQIKHRENWEIGKQRESMCEHRFWFLAIF